jgi:hypothetical protein
MNNIAKKLEITGFKVNIFEGPLSMSDFNPRDNRGWIWASKRDL